MNGTLGQPVDPWRSGRLCTNAHDYSLFSIRTYFSIPGRGLLRKPHRRAIGNLSDVAAASSMCRGEKGSLDSNL
eukprot:scaffold2656_cov365-Pavlova_lutheri.AAC.10